MKNAIHYYYHLEPQSIHQTGRKFYFQADNQAYVLIHYENIDEIQAIYDLDYALLQRGIYCHQIILNNTNTIITEINHEPYVLMKVFVPKKPIDLNDILAFNNMTGIDEKSKLRRDDWYTLWTHKIDYFEYQINQIGKKYSLITESSSYYIGLAENAIALIKNVPKEKLHLSLSHRRILCKDTTYNLYNPLNIVIDVRIRDACEYFKSCFFQTGNNVDIILSYLENNRFEYTESCYFFARLLFPTYYFDMYESILNNQAKEEDIQKITAKVDDFELLLKQVYHYLKQKGSIPEIEWLQK